MTDQEKTYGVPAILSLFVPGLGQIVKGQLWKGIGMLIAAGISGLLTFVLIGFLIYPLVWIYSVYDAYNN